MGPGPSSKGLLYSRRLLQVFEAVERSAARASAAAHHLEGQLRSFTSHSDSHFSAPTDDEPSTLYGALRKQPHSASASPFGLPQAKGFASEAVNERHSYEKRVRDVRKKYIEELADKRRREQAFEQKKREILAARKQELKEAKQAAVRAGAEEKERLLEERREQRELRRLEGWERQKEMKAEIQLERDAKNELIIASSKTWVAEEDLESRIELALDNPYAL